MEYIVLSYCRYPSTDAPVVVCYTTCTGDEDELTECYLRYCTTINTCDHSNDVGVTCSK